MIPETARSEVRRAERAAETAERAAETKEAALPSAARGRQIDSPLPAGAPDLREGWPWVGRVMEASLAASLAAPAGRARVALGQGGRAPPSSPR